jgi:hypothetical protein
MIWLIVIIYDGFFIYFEECKHRRDRLPSNRKLKKIYRLWNADVIVEDRQLLVPRLQVFGQIFDRNQDCLHQALVLVGVLLLELA